MPRPPVRLVVTDLDNTLYDWLKPWHRQLHTLIAGAIQATSLDQSTIEAMLAAIHRRAGTAEPPDPLDLDPILCDRIPPAERARLHAEADRAAEAALHLYPSVESTLAALRGAKIRVIGYTESAPGPTARRLCQLGLDRTLDRVICLQTDPPAAGKLPDAYNLRIAPARARKPHPQALLAILDLVGAEPETTLYVGNSRRRDIAMALAAGVPCAWAAYGDIPATNPGMLLLERTSHWTSADFHREYRMSADSIQATYRLDEGLHEILPIVAAKP